MCVFRSEKIEFSDDTKCKIEKLIKEEYDKLGALSYVSAVSIEITLINGTFKEYTITMYMMVSIDYL